MKKVIAGFAVLTMYMFSCKETPPIIKFSDTAVVDSTDTLSVVPAADPHNVLIEDFTGPQCTNCPSAHKIIEDMQAANPGRINALALYIKYGSQSTPCKGAKYNFSNDSAVAVQGSVFGGVPSLPIGGIDRLPLGSASKPYLVDYDNWNADVPAQFGLVDSINLSVRCNYNNVNGIATISATVTYLRDDTAAKNLTIAILEDSLIDIQEDPSFLSNYDSNYVFNNVFRGTPTSVPYGDAVAPNIKLKVHGLQYTRTYTYKLASDWNPKQCRVVAFVTRGDASAGRVVYQSVQTRVQP